MPGILISVRPLTFTTHLPETSEHLISGGACLKFAFNLANVMHHLVDFLNETIANNNKNNPIKICNFSTASKMESFASSDAQDHIELVGYA